MCFVLRFRYRLLYGLSSRFAANWNIQLMFGRVPHACTNYSRLECAPSNRCRLIFINKNSKHTTRAEFLCDSSVEITLKGHDFSFRQTMTYDWSPRARYDLRFADVLRRINIWSLENNKYSSFIDRVHFNFSRSFSVPGVQIKYAKKASHQSPDRCDHKINSKFKYEFDAQLNYKLESIHSSTSVIVFTDSNTKSALVSISGAPDIRNNVAFPFKTFQGEKNRNYWFTRNSIGNSEKKNEQTRITSSSLLSSPAKIILISFVIHASPNISARITLAASPKTQQRKVFISFGCRRRRMRCRVSVLNFCVAYLLTRLRAV